MPQAARSWLSRQAQALVMRTAEMADEPFDCDLLIVGSGYGGAVAAARAAGQKLVDDSTGKTRSARVWVLERGNEYLPGMFPSRFSEIAGHVRFDVQDGRPARGVEAGLFDARLGPDVCVLLGNGLGGGSLINAGVMAEPDPEVFSHHWPSAITRDALNDGYSRAEEMLRFAPVPGDRQCDKLRSFFKVAEPETVDLAPVTVHWEAGPNAAGIVMKACTLCGDCMTGCNQSAKGSVDTSYLAYARSRGVEFYCGGTVRTLARDQDDKYWEVNWEYTESALRPADRKPFVVRARRVVLAAGSLGSTEILLRSRSQGLMFLGRLGEGFSFNGGKITAGARHEHIVHSVGDEETDPSDVENSRWIGPTITGLLRIPPGTDENGRKTHGFVIEEFAVPAGLRNVFAEIVAVLASLTRNTIGSRDPYALASEDIDRISLYGLTGDDDAAGCLALPERGSHEPASEGIRIDWPGAGKLPLFRSMAKWLTKHLAPAVPVPDSLFSEFLPATTVHPLGGCRMGDDFASGVVDHRGCVFVSGTEARDDLVVLDGSIVPRALGINPALTITALAERAMPLLLQAWGWSERAARPDELTRPEGRRRELPGRDVVWSIRERLQGPFAIDGQHFWARMEIEFEDIPGFRRALELQSRSVAVRRATLELFPARAGDDLFTVDEPQGAPVCRAELGGSVALFVPIPGDKPEDERVMLSYRLSVQSVRGHGAVLAIGDRLDGVKVFGGEPPEGEKPMSPIRQLTEMDVRYNGIAAPARWVLDMEDLAHRRDPLLRLVRLSSMPDALDDLAAIALYVGRRALRDLNGLEDKLPEGTEQRLNQRWPGAVDGVAPSVTSLCGGGRLSRYVVPAKVPRAQLPPVLLVHGLAYSGASFTDESMPDGLAATLLRAGREVWVLDVRSSIANERARHGLDFQDAQHWTVDSVARADLPAAIDKVFAATGEKPVDVFAHCMGAVMFCLAALGGDEMNGKVRAVVLSQVGPLIRFSPLNRLRGYLASYLQQYLQITTLDTCPAFESRIEPDGSVSWTRRNPGMAGILLNGLLAWFPYPDEDDEAERATSETLENTDFLPMRHRGDAIFGQLYELENLSDEVLARLEVFMGWAMVPMLSQAIHYARRNMLTNAAGFNAVLNAANFAGRFRFPLLIIHGRLNRLFNWRGSHDSWKLLKSLRDEETHPPEPLPNNKGTIYGRGTPTQLAVFEGYGHMDCIIGKCAHKDIFGVVQSFFADADGHRTIGSKEPKTQFEAPWIGPVIGRVRTNTNPARKDRLRVRLQVHPQLRRSKTKAIVIVPMQTKGGIQTPRVFDACAVSWPTRADRYSTFDLEFSTWHLSKKFDSFALLTMHVDLELKIDARMRRRPWLWHARGPALPINKKEAERLEEWIADPAAAAALASSLFSLTPKVVLAADSGDFGEAPADICFALASCQYPPGLFDERPAAASYRRLEGDAMAANGPQFLVLCGDQVYVDEAAGLFDPVAAAPLAGELRDSALHRTYELNWRLPPFRRTTARLPVYTMLDDHEVRDNWKGLKQEPTPPREPVQDALEAYDVYQEALNPEPAPGGGHLGRGYFAWPAGVPLAVLDTRSQRSPRDATSIGTATIIPPDVMATLKQKLCAAPEDAVKLVVSPSPLLPPERFDPQHPAERLRSDTWCGFPASVVDLLGFIRDEKVRRVVFLSGDAHQSSVTSFTFDGGSGNQVISVVSSGMYAPWPFANQRPDELVLNGDVDLGLPESPCKGTLRLHAMSTSDGYAVVSTRHADGNAWLTVSLRSASGATTDCRIQLT